MPRFFFAQIEVMCVVKTQYKYLRSIKIYFNGFSQTVHAVRRVTRLCSEQEVFLRIKELQ